MTSMDWGKKDEFVQEMLRRANSVHPRRFYGLALRRSGELRQQCLRGVAKVPGFFTPGLPLAPREGRES